ncbi:MAG: DUF5069 domain-containing protein [Vampirovibrionales bacterium]|nr:DUF5069 domain-containing protein [Vampirovibrionales bacterium]
MTQAMTKLALAKDLTVDFPRSPRETLAGFVLAARMLDKCRAVISGTAGEYHFNCPLDKKILEFAGIDAEAFKAFVATGANDDQVAQWIQANAKQQDRTEIVRWNNQLRDTRINDMPIELQLYMEDYIAENVPKGKIIYHWFDVYDAEEQRI